MKTVIKSDKVSINGQQLPVLGGAKYGAYREILEAAANQLDAMLSYHSRVLVVRFDIHMPVYTPDNERISKFRRRVQKLLKGEALGYVWVREQEKAKKQHYHFVFFLDKDKHNNANKIIKQIIEPTCQKMALSLSCPSSCYHTVKRKDVDGGESYSAAFKRCSYLAKTRGKGYKAKTANNFSASRLKNNSDAVYNAE